MFVSGHDSRLFVGLGWLFVKCLGFHFAFSSCMNMRGFLFFVFVRDEKFPGVW